MTARNLQSFDSDLELSGFIQTDADHFRYEPTAGKNPKRLELPWQILSWELESKGDTIHQQSFAASLNAEHFLQNFEDILRDRFPAFRKVALQEDRKSGFWLLIEFLEREKDADQSRLIESEDAISHELPHGLVAMHISVIQAVGQISLFMTKHCFIGHTPGGLFIELPKIVNQSLFGSALSNKTSFNAYLLTLKSEDLRTCLIDFCQFPDFVHNLVGVRDFHDNGFGQTKLSFEGRNWRLKWSHGEDMPELLVPPMEILEQKEVARRFQKLDELILLEDFAAALKQCKEFIDKNPHSLYLIRRWAFLSLWAGIEFEQKYLDLMVKFDPTNLMTLSLWVRHGLETVNADVLLENLSKLGSSLGQAIVEFDSLDITGLTLPEMLGDAWNQKDDQRAVSCYERVLHSRGEIPRILVKLIRLMRDIEDPTAEEAYMDRLLSCEVPQRTRAAIYYRLAEIKQKIDPTDASQWALKSWHTNKGQVRYALLAADLLLQLQRPHDAAHVLVETSELTEETPNDQRLLLEIKIAAIWLENMQRLDLASERITRALDLVIDEVLIFDEIFRLVQKLDDPILLIDVTTRALFLSQTLGDLDRTTRFVQVLLDLGDTADDNVMAGNIFTVVLKNTLLSVAYTLSLFQREDLKLPFREIVTAMEERIVLLAPKEQGVYYQLLGDLYQDKSEDPERIFAYYEKALTGDFMNTRSFDFLDSYYSRVGKNSERFALLQKKLNQAQGSERAVLLRELYYFDEGVNGRDKDSYALQILAADPDDVGPIEERLSVYEQNHDGEAIIGLMNQMKSYTISPAVMMMLIRTALTFVKEMQSSGRHLWLVQLLGKLREMGENQIDLARLTVQYLWDADEKNWVRGPLELLISRGELPDIDPDEMLALIEDESLKVDLLLQLADRGSDAEEILAYERHALRLTKDVPMMMSIKLEIQHRLVTKSEFATGDLDGFLKQIRSMGNETEALHYLLAQLRLSTSDSHKNFVMDQVQASLQGFNISAEDGEQFVSLLTDLPVADTARIRLTWLERYGVTDRIHDHFFLEYVLSDPSLWSHRTIILHLMEYHLGQNGPKAREAKATINSFMCRLVLEKRDETFRFFVDQDLILKVLDSRTTKAAMDYSLHNKDGSLFQSFWWMTMIRLVDRSEIVEFLNYSRRSFDALAMGKNFFARIEDLAEHDGSAVDPNVLYEIRLFYADYLIESNSGSRKARKILESLHAEFPQESRIWGILIALYREIQAEFALHELLQRVLPYLKDDPRPLKEYQLSVSGLEQEFLELSARQSSLRDGPVEVVTMRYFGNQGIDSEAAAVLSDDLSEVDHTILSTGRDQFEKMGFTVAENDLDRTVFQLDVENLGNAAYARSSAQRAEQASFDFNEPGLNIEHTQTGLALLKLEPPPVLRDKSDLSSSPFSFGDDSQQFDLEEKNRLPNQLPMHTQLAELPGVDMPMRADSKRAGINPGIRAPEPLSFFENTNVYSPTHDMSLPPPPPAPSFAPLSSDLAAEETSAKEFKSRYDNDSRSSASAAVDISSFEPQNPAEAIAPRDDASAAWRRVARSLVPDTGLLESILSYPLKDMAENIIAVQVAALIDNNVASLDSFPQRVWRDPQSIRYEFKWIDRMDREMFHPGIKSPLARVLKALYPLFIQAFVHEMGISGVADRLKMRPDEIQKVRKAIPLTDELIQRTSLRYYTAALKDNGYHLYHLPSIGDRFQFDFEKRDIYIDRNHYMAAPSSRIFHRLTFLLRAVSLDYYPFLHLSTGGEIFPFLMKCKRSLDQNDSVKRVLGMDKDPLRAILAQAKDRDYLTQLFNELGNVSADRISQTISHFIEQIYRLNLAETLDLIGIIETISGVDLVNPRTNSFQRISQSASAKSILAFAADLKLNNK